jgi:hypothetical protein
MHICRDNDSWVAGGDPTEGSQGFQFHFFIAQGTRSARRRNGGRTTDFTDGNRDKKVFAMAALYGTIRL